MAPKKKRARTPRAPRRPVDEPRAGERDRNEFLGLLGHELRSPLALLSNGMRLLRDPNVEEAVRREAQDMMGRQITRMLRLVDDLLDAARIPQGGVELRKARVELATTLRQADENARWQIESRRQKLETTLPSETVWLDADALRLQQVFGYLLDNASKFSRTGGRIRLSAELPGGETPREIAVKVEDEGIGIEPDMLGRVFDLFMQAGGSANGTRNGLGIGLTLAKCLVEMHGGTIEARSAGRGKGSQFVVRLPIESSRQSSRGASILTPENHRTKGDPSSRRILVVDDDVDGARALGLLLQASGHEVRVAFTGQDCLEALDLYDPEIVLLDLGLPGMDGFEIAQRVRSQRGPNGLLLIAISGYGRDEDRVRAREAGFDHHLVKPTDLDALQHILESYTPRT